MATFVIEVYRPGLTADSAAGLVHAVERLLEARGTHKASIRYGGSILAPADEVCYLRVESPGRPAVEAFVRRLAWSDARISEVVDLG